MTSTSGTTSKRKRRWPRWLAIVLLLLVMVAFVGYQFAKRSVRNQVTKQLNELGLGKPTIGGISISQDGVEAKQIEFRQDDEDPWLFLDKLSIKHPLKELVWGVETYNEIDLDGARAVIDLDEYADGASADSLSLDFALQDLVLPARKINLNEAQVVMRRSGRPDLIVDEIQATFADENGEIRIEGSVGDLVGAKWGLDGKVDRANNELRLDMKTAEIPVVNGVWQQWPGMPENLEDVIQADGQLSLDLNLRYDDQNAIQLTGSGRILSLDLEFPAFELPLSISQGDIWLTPDRLVVDNIVGTIDGNDRITSQSETTLSFPIETTFKTKFEDVTAESWRRFVYGIPDALTASTDGVASGTIRVFESTRMSIDIDAQATASDAVYERISAEKMVAKVNIKDLIFDEVQAYESIDGAVDVEATAGLQPLRNVFETFELGDLESQLAIVGDGTGEMKLHLPLATAEELTTWEMDIDASVPSGNVAGQVVKDVTSTIKMKNGFLVFDPIRGIAISDRTTESVTESGKNLTLRINWPMTEQLAKENSGSVSVSGTQVPAHWVAGFLNHQFAAESDAELLDLDKTLESEITGNVSFATDIEMSPNEPDAIKDWRMEGTFFDSVLSTRKDRLHKLAGKWTLKNGTLDVNGVSGTFASGGQLSGGGQVNLLTNADSKLSVSADDVPFHWLVTFLDDNFPGLRNQLQLDDLKVPADPNALNGLVDLKLSYEKPKPEESEFTLDLNAESNELTVGQDKIRDLLVAFRYDGSLKINNFQGRLNETGSFQAGGQWSFESKTGDVEVKWRQVPLVWISTALFDQLPDDLSGWSNANLRIKSNDSTKTPDISGSLGFLDVSFGPVVAKDVAFDLVTRDRIVHLENFRNRNNELGLELKGTVSLEEPVEIDLAANFQDLRLSQLFESSSFVNRETGAADVTGVANGDFNLKIKVEPFDWQTSGKVTVQKPTFNQRKLDNILLEWEHFGNDWKKSKIQLQAFGGTIKMVELTSKPERVRMTIDDVDALQIMEMLSLPVEFSGRLSGEASLNEWSLAETRWADLTIKGSSILLGPTEFGDFTANAEYRKKVLAYDLNGTLLGGKLSGEGKTSLEDDFVSTALPLQLNLTNASLNELYRGSNYFRKLKPLRGQLSANADLKLSLNGAASGDGRIRADEVKWNGDVLTRQSSVHVAIANQRIVISDIKADLKRGSISGKADIPIGSNAPGTYELDIRRFDIERMAEIFGADQIQAKGLFDARIDGQLGRQITGRGYIGAHRASVSGLSSQSIRLPVQFRVSAIEGRGKIELRRSTFRLFNGNVSGKAEISFGDVVDVDTDLRFTDIDTGKMLNSLANFSNADQGKLSGQLKISGRAIRSTRDLNGSFQGRLRRVAAFHLPVLEDVARVLSGNNVKSGDYSSDEIRLILDNDRIDVRQLNFSSSLVKIAITGHAYLDGRLNLYAAARVDRLQQPGLIDEIAGSPLARLSQSPAAFFVQAADFLSERIVFLRITGTFDRPQVRVDTSQQLREELIRYFLRDSQYLPNAAR